MALEKLETLNLYRGASSVINVRLDDWDFEAGACLFTIRDMTSDTVFFEKTFHSKTEANENNEYEILIPDTLSLKLRKSNSYKYDFMILVDDLRFPDEQRFPVCSLSSVKIIDVAGREQE